MQLLIFLPYTRSYAYIILDLHFPSSPCMPLHPGVKFGENWVAEWARVPCGVGARAGKTFANYRSLWEIDYFIIIITTCEYAASLPRCFLLSLYSPPSKGNKLKVFQISENWPICPVPPVSFSQMG